MTINASNNPVNQLWQTWQHSLQEQSKSTGDSHAKDISHSTPAAVHRQKAQRQHQPASSLTQQRLSQAQPRAAEPAQTPGNIFTTLVEVPRSLTGAPITLEFDNGNVKITSSPLHLGSFNGTSIQRNKVTIETGSKDDLVEIKTLTTGGVVAEINGKAYALPIENIGAMTEQLEIQTNNGKDQVTIADNIWFETTVSLNHSHRVTGLNGYTSAPESSGKKTFLEPGVIPVAAQMKPEGNSQVFRHGDVTITFDPNKNALQFGDGVTIIKTGDGADTVHIMAAEDGSMVAQINGEKFLLPVKNDATGHSRLYITTQGGDDKTIIDANVKNYAFILPGEDKNGSLYRGGGFVSGTEEPRLAQRYRSQNYNPVANASS